jgi:hypothetical protein
MKHPWYLSLGVFLGFLPLGGEATEVRRLQLVFPASGCEDKAAKLRIELPAGGIHGELSAPLPQPLSLPRPPVGARLIVESDRCFVPVVKIEAQTLEELRLRTDPLAWVTFQLEGTSKVELRLAFAEGFRWSRESFPLESRCEVGKGEVKCPIPAKRVHLRLAPERGAPHYFWALQAGPGETVSLGKLSARPGGSIVGWVEPPRGERLPPGVEVMASKESSAGRSLQETVPGWPRPVPPELRVTALANPSGFFQLVGLSTGLYDLAVVSGNRHVGAVPEIPVQAEQEVVLEAPIPLDWGRELWVSVDPPWDPRGQSWVVELHRRISEPEEPWDFYLDPVAQKTTDPSGQAVFGDLPAGAYALVLRFAGEVALREPVDIGGEGEPLERWVFLKPQLVPVFGKLRCGGKPLAGEVWLFLRQKDSEVRQKLELDSEGGFSTWLPPGRAELVWGKPPQGRLLLAQKKLELTTQAWELDRELEGSSVSGQVFGSNGERRPGSTVRLVRKPEFDPATDRTESIQAVANEEGRFEVECVPAGRWEIGATDEAGGEESDAILLDLQPEGGVSDLELRLKRLGFLKVSLRRSGLQVVGSGSCFPLGRELVGPLYGLRDISRAGWELEFRPPAGEVSCVLWDQESMVLRRLVATQQEAPPVVVELPQPSETARLVLYFPSSDPEFDPTKERVLPRWLVRGGSRMVLDMLLAPGNWRYADATRTRFRTMGLEAGEYQLCGIRSGCQPFFLARGSEVAVEGEELSRLEGRN